MPKKRISEGDEKFSRFLFSCVCRALALALYARARAMRYALARRRLGLGPRAGPRARPARGAALLRVQIDRAYVSGSRWTAQPLNLPALEEAHIGGTLEIWMLPYQKQHYGG